MHHRLHHHVLKPLAVALAALLGLAVATSAAAAGTESAEAEILAMDKNGDGVLTAAEHGAGARTMFVTMDGNQDGRVTAAEMDAYQAKRTVRDAAKEKPSAEKIRMVDTDGDGALSAEEHRTASQKMFITMDADSDGTLSKSELATGHAKMLLKK
ncbi:EF-hand domain-containing protein [Piscinibacter gummiphilus]|uniref:Uncharacterized protein n=1 Tax=Piscinibacter gummiphilus TaxID=946333 RepID=A0A1W6L3C1_9BURK|nr:hypothetical protein [Piscinibacter gummiphilus]ARN18779.1 hypothetical protein A4W93_01930 [Piscinibacter gummiphilus]ATU63421.1 hypothetical protein CPZ87_01995 [Piscinibacter gummiphilus]GLS95934.1 hypothetical protein GCM10007918_32260 [Piscinibacter gummiphilus]